MDKAANIKAENLFPWQLHCCKSHMTFINELYVIQKGFVDLMCSRGILVFFYLTDIVYGPLGFPLLIAQHSWCSNECLHGKLIFRQPLWHNLAFFWQKYQMETVTGFSTMWPVGQPWLRGSQLMIPVLCHASTTWRICHVMVLITSTIRLCYFDMCGVI